MKPAARLHLIKQREYVKTCPEGMLRPGVSKLTNPWTSPESAFSGGGSENSYYYGIGIGQPSAEETYGTLCTFVSFYVLAVIFAKRQGNSKTSSFTTSIIAL